MYEISPYHVISFRYHYESYRVEPVCYGHLGTSQKCISLHNNVSFGTTARCVDYADVHISTKLILRVIASHIGTPLIIWENSYVSVWIMQVSTFSDVLINRFTVYTNRAALIAQVMYYPCT